MKTLLVTLGLILFSTGCKTRAQLRDEGTPASTPARSAQAEPSGNYAVDEMKSEIARLNGRIDDLERSERAKSGQDTANFNSKVQAMEARIVELEEAQQEMILAMKRGQTKKVTENPEDFYRQAQTSYQAGELDQAIQSLSDYLSSPQAQNPEEAVFLRGEAQFKQRKYKKAILDYRQVVEKYKKSKHASEALFKIGMSFEALGQASDAKLFFSEVVEKFPESKEAKQAKQKLAKK